MLACRGRIRRRLRTPEPVNKFPAFVRYLVQRLQTMCARVGKVKIAQVLARAGLHLGATTVGRMRRQTPAAPPAASPLVTPPRSPRTPQRAVPRARRPSRQNATPKPMYKRAYKTRWTTTRDCKFPQNPTNHCPLFFAKSDF